MRHERVPVIRGRDHHRINLLVIEQRPKVRVTARLAAGKRNPFIAAAAVHLREGHERSVGLILEVQNVPLTDQPEADKTKADPFIRTKNPPVRRGRKRRRRSSPDHRSPAHLATGPKRTAHDFELPLS